MVDMIEFKICCFGHDLNDSLGFLYIVDSNKLSIMQHEMKLYMFTHVTIDDIYAVKVKEGSDPLPSH